VNQKALLENEKVEYEGRLHWKIFIVPTCICAGLLLGAIAIYDQKIAPKNVPILFGLWILASFAILLPALLKYVSSWIVVTNQRVIARTGVLGRQSFDMLLVKVEGVSVDQGLLGRLFNFGTVIIRGIGGGKEYYDAFGDPSEISRQVHQQIVNLSIPRG
jgi:uncharacterized membrane protein YdbT with pleckstrin-like domain